MSEQANGRYRINKDLGDYWQISRQKLDATKDEEWEAVPLKFRLEPNRQLSDFDYMQSAFSKREAGAEDMTNSAYTVMKVIGLTCQV